MADRYAAYHHLLTQSIGWYHLSSAAKHHRNDACSQEVTMPYATNDGVRMPDLQLLRLDHAPALLAFERENRAYFAAVVPDRGDEFFAEFDTQHAQLLEWQAARTDYFHLLVTERGEVVGRVNLTKVADGSAELGYRIAQKAAGQGLATAAVRKVRELAATKYGLTRLRARVTLDNPASRKVLEHNGFVAGGSLTLNGKLAMSYICELR